MLQKILRNPERVATGFRFDERRRNPFRVASYFQALVIPRVAKRNPGLKLANAFSVNPMLAGGG